MRIIHIETLISAGGFPTSAEWGRLRNHILRATRALDWPPGSGSFTLYAQSGKKRREGNGVKPIKNGLMSKLEAAGWVLEEPLDIAVVKRPGKLDAVHYSSAGPVALEWETGNISSSHRALNKMALGLLKGALVGGVLIVPTREMYQYLTDRVGNYAELVPYLDLWSSIQCGNGVLEIVAVQHDATSLNVPPIPKMTAGRAIE